MSITLITAAKKLSKQIENLNISTEDKIELLENIENYKNELIANTSN